jgi:hypothetical protein
VVLYGAGNVVFSSGSSDRTPAGSESERQRTDQVQTGQVQTDTPMGTWRPLSSAEMEQCRLPADQPGGMTAYGCVIARAEANP